MARSARLKLALLGAAVGLGHLVALEWLGRQADALSALRAMAPPMLTRLLQPVKPPPVASVAQAPAAPRRTRAAVPPTPPASSPAPNNEEVPPPQPQAAAVQEAEPASEPVVAQAEAANEPVVAQAEPASDPVVAQAEPASEPASSAVPPAASLDHWPVDTRLSYDVTGHWRGPLYGNARVLWQRADGKYQVRLDIDLGLVSQVLTSQGEVTPQGLLPQVYEEQRPGKRRIARIGEQVVTLENGRTLPRPDGVQDTASQFVELSQRFATGQDMLEVGRTVSVWLARPGGVDHWTYDIVEKEMLRLPRIGEVEAFRLVPRPIDKPRGNFTAEMWFAPSLQYLPVRIRVNMGTEAWIDLMVEKIEQR
ncbi:DUF3108 domain-containing protein [Ramlibacter sp. PS3R-8]|uniref:DUF3108 domain-containing protein n=1 Tax=Ramlibacter sp. PS3R-8 TaxID=3133437 RepID=UPI0030A19E1E